MNGDAIVAAIVDVDGVYEGESLLAFGVQLSESELPFTPPRLLILSQSYTVWQSCSRQSLPAKMI